MKRIINTFKYGAPKVKRTLAIAILAGLITVVFGMMTLALSSMLCFFVTIMAAFITISLVQTFMIAEGEHPTIVRPDTDMKTEGAAPMVMSTPSDGKDKKTKKVKVANTPEKAKKEKVKKEKVKKEKIKKEELKEGNQVAVTEQYYEPEELEQDLYSQALEAEDDADERPDKTKFKMITEQTAATYTKKKIKKTLHKYKVIKDHRMVIVDRCDKLHIYQSPAFIWIQDNQFHLLLIEEEPRLLMVPLFKINEITYLKKQPADEEKDYKLFQKNTILTESFRPYLPDYNHSNKTSDLTSYKNLYGIYQGIYFTNNSAKNLFDLLGVDFYVEDKVTTSNKVNIFFKEAYKANIKLRDNILDANGYAESITKVLDDMAHSTISHNEFKDTLNLMIRNKLITEEYASHYMDVRNSLHG